MRARLRFGSSLLGLVLCSAVAGAQCEVDQIQPAGSEAMDLFGQSLALDGDRLLVGATNALTGPLVELFLPDVLGAVHVFRRGGGDWLEAGELVPGVSHPLDQYGLSVALHDRLAVVGAPNSQGRGAVFVFTATESGWSQVAMLQPADSAPGQRFGQSLALAGKRLLVGAPGDAELFPGAGAAYTFEQLETGWVQTQKLYERIPAQNAAFGTSCDLEAGRLVVGASSIPFGDTGRALVFEPAAGGWKQVAQLGPGPGPAIQWALDVDLRGDTLLVAGGSAEVATVFQFDGESWLGTKLFSDGPAGAGDRVALAMGRAVVGTRGASDVATLAGTVHLYEQDAEEWMLRARIDPPTVLVTEQFGSSLALRGDELLIGGPFHEVFEGPQLGGSVHVFSLGDACESD